MPSKQIDLRDVKEIDLEGVELFDENGEMAPPTPDPLAAIEYQGKLEPDCKAEMSALLKAFSDRKTTARAQFRELVDTEYWFCVCFQNRAQKNAFLAAIGWLELGDKYLPGDAVAKKMNVELPEAAVRFGGEDKDDVVIRNLKQIP